MKSLSDFDAIIIRATAMHYNTNWVMTYTFNKINQIKMVLITGSPQLLFKLLLLEFMDFPPFSFPGKREIFGLISRETGNSREMHLLSTCIKKSIKNWNF